MLIWEFISREYPEPAVIMELFSFRKLIDILNHLDELGSSSFPSFSPSFVPFFFSSFLLFLSPFLSFFPPSFLLSFSLFWFLEIGFPKSG